MSETLSLEEFERQRQKQRKRSKWREWLEELEQLTPTKVPNDNNRELGSLQNSITHSWRENTERKGNIRTSIIENELWIVWYPEGDTN